MAFRRRFCVFKNKSPLKCIHCQHWLSALINHNNQDSTKILWHYFGKVQIGPGILFLWIYHNKNGLSIHRITANRLVFDLKFQGFSLKRIKRKSIFPAVELVERIFSNGDPRHIFLRGPPPSCPPRLNPYTARHVEVYSMVRALGLWQREVTNPFTNHATL